MTSFRKTTKPVKVGNICVGNKFPIRIQSMINTNPQDFKAALNQTIELYENGSQMVRFAIPRLKDIETITKVKAEIIKQKIQIPLIADVHFNSSIAKEAAQVFDKVRINPGNYSEENMVSTNKFSDENYIRSLHKIKSNLKELVNICKKYQTALRIGVNYGSLSSRILYKYGNTPEGMAESAMEYLRICNSLKFQEIIVSIKASNPKIMSKANRLLVEKMTKESLNFPIHLGVTEAGTGEDARIKSALGIGALLLEGIGDTIRVSLTENPVNELPFANKLVEYISCLNIREYETNLLKRLRTKYCNQLAELQTIVVSDQTCVSKNSDFEPDYIFRKEKILTYSDNREVLFRWVKYEELADISKLEFYDIDLVIIQAANIFEYCEILIKLKALSFSKPIVFAFDSKEKDFEKRIIEFTLSVGVLLMDGFGNGVFLKNQSSEFAFSLLQATRRRISKAEFVMCPSCGRTRFDIEEIAKKVKQCTAHLTGLTIAVMGCIVNGPSEMGDADYGYIGAGTSKISLYRNNKLVKKNINEQDAIHELIALIKTDGKWVEP